MAKRYDIGQISIFQFILDDHANLDIEMSRIEGFKTCKGCSKDFTEMDGSYCSDECEQGETNKEQTDKNQLDMIKTYNL